VKSESDKPIVLKPHGYEWLSRLDIPLFLMTVHLEEARARRYSFEWALAYGTTPGWTELFVDRPRRLEPVRIATVVLSVEGKDPTFQNTEDDPQRIWLGPMLAEFHLAQLSDDTMVRAIQALLKGWCASLTDLIYLRRQGIRYTLHWSAGTLPALAYAEINASAGNEAATTQTLKRIVPMIDLLSLQTDPSDVALAAALATIRQRADERGIPRLPGVHV
jgi:hypothetical protein